MPARLVSTVTSAVLFFTLTSARQPVVPRQAVEDRQIVEAPRLRHRQRAGRPHVDPTIVRLRLTLTGPPRKAPPISRIVIAVSEKLQQTIDLRQRRQGRIDRHLVIDETEIAIADAGGIGIGERHFQRQVEACRCRRRACPRLHVPATRRPGWPDEAQELGGRARPCRAPEQRLVRIEIGNLGHRIADAGAENAAPLPSTRACRRRQRRLPSICSSSGQPGA